MCFIRPVGIAVSVIAVLIFVTPVHAQYNDLTSRIPDGANALILIDVEKILATPLAQKEDWRSRQDAAFKAGLLLAPPDAEKFVMAAKIDFESMKSEKEVSIMTLSHEPSMAKVAARYGGSADKIEGRDSAVLPDDVFVIKFGPRIAAVGYPAIRQDVARWIKHIDSNQLQGLSPYLKEAQQFAEKNAHIMMALDLEHVLPAEHVRQRLESFAAIKETKTDLDALSRAIASIRGISLGINVGETRSGSIKIDFAEDVSLLKDFAKPVLLEVLANQGAMIEEFEEWNCVVSGKQVRLNGTLLASGMRRLMSLLNAPVSLQEAAKQSPSENDPKYKAELVATSSQQYFKSVASLLDDLKESKHERKSFGQIGVWFGKYADKIDKLPMVNVDDAILDYSQSVSTALRQGKIVVQQASVASRVNQQQAASSASGAYGYGWNGYTGYYSVPASYGTLTSTQLARQQARTQARTQAQLGGTLSANTILEQIEIATTMLRRQMTEKYNIEF